MVLNFRSFRKRMIGKSEIFRFIKVTLFVHLLLMNGTFSKNSTENFDKAYEVDYSPLHRSMLSLSWLNTTIETDQNLNGVLCGTNMVYKLKYEKVLESVKNIRTYFCECEEGFIESSMLCALKPLIKGAETVKTTNKLNKEEIGYCELQGSICGDNMAYYIINFLNIKTDYGYLCQLRCFCNIQCVQIGGACVSHAHCHRYNVLQQNNIALTIYIKYSCYDLVDPCGDNSMLLLKSQVIFENRIQCNIMCMCKPGYTRSPFVCMRNNGTTKKSIKKTTVVRGNPDYHNLDVGIQNTRDPSKPPRLPSIRHTIVENCIWENMSCGKNMVLTLETRIINIPRVSIKCRYRCLCSPGYKLVLNECIKGKNI